MPRQKYAERTKVPIEKTIKDLKDLLNKNGASGFGTYEKESKAMIVFEYKGAAIRITFGLAKREKYSTKELYEQEEMRIWRVIFLVTKAKFEAIREGITTFEKEFLADFILPDNETLGKHLIPHLKQVIQEGKIPPLLSE